MTAESTETAPDAGTHGGDILAVFSAVIEEQEDVLYGIALFYEDVSLLYAGQAAVVETYRKQFRNIIQSGTQTIQRARELMDEAQGDPAHQSRIQAFAFAPGEGHPDPAALVIRAKAMVAAFTRLYPDRARDKPLSEAETLALVEAASEESAVSFTEG